jgi:hypothetical protein
MRLAICRAILAAGLDSEYADMRASVAEMREQVEPSQARQPRKRKPARKSK